MTERLVFESLYDVMPFGETESVHVRAVYETLTNRNSIAYLSDLIAVYSQVTDWVRLDQEENLRLVIGFEDKVKDRVVVGVVTGVDYKNRLMHVVCQDTYGNMFQVYCNP